MTDSVPSYVHQNIEARKIKKNAEDLIEHTQEGTVDYFRNGGLCEGVKFSESKQEKIDMGVVTAWAFRNLPTEHYERLFTKLPDPNGFATLVSQGVIDPAMLPPEYKEVKSVPRITVAKEK